MITYRYILEGTGAKDEAWRTEGKVEATAPGAFLDAIDTAMRKGFMDLTAGQATYGEPGMRGCSGPYRMKRLTFTEVPEEGKTGTWFNRHERFGDCKPDEVYIGMGVFAAFSQPEQTVVLRKADASHPDGGVTIRIDHGSISILAGAMTEWKEKHGR